VATHRRPIEACPTGRSASSAVCPVQDSLYVVEATGFDRLTGARGLGDIAFSLMCPKVICGGAREPFSAFYGGRDRSQDAKRGSQNSSESGEL